MTLDGRRLVHLCLLAALGVTACGNQKGDSSETDGYAPDIAGRYNVEVLGIAGCENESVWLADWAVGRLDVTGEGDSLTFDFGDETRFRGRIESDGGFRFSGAVSLNGAELSVTGTGVAGIAPTDPGDASQALLDGELSVVVDFADAPTCTIEGPFEATELVDFE